KGRGCRSQTTGSVDGDQPRSGASCSARLAATPVAGAAGPIAECPLARSRCREHRCAPTVVKGGVMDSNDGEVGIRLDAGLQERVAAYAAREGLTVGESLSALLYLGLEFAERQRTGLKEDIEDLQRELRDLKQMVDVLGPAALGTQRILVHWAAQTGGLRVSEDELLAEGRLVADEEWQGELAGRGLLSSGTLTGKLEG